MNPYLAALLTLAVLMATPAAAEEGDPVRNAQRMKDCIAERVARKDGQSSKQMKHACSKAIADGTYKDANISLDGMIKPQS